MSDSMEIGILTSDVYDEYELVDRPAYVGCYKIGDSCGLSFVFQEKPCWFHRIMTRLALGWTWVDFPSKDAE